MTPRNLTYFAIAAVVEVIVLAAYWPKTRAERRTATVSARGAT